MSDFKIALPINANTHPETYEFAIQGRGAYDYTWIFAMGIIGTILTAAATGSNDVANSWATSVGARSLKMWQAVVLASIMEFAGAFLMGARTADFIKNNIVSPSVYTNHEDLLMFGMMNTVFLVGWWNFYASYLELNVSTTHSIIGCIIGFALCTPAGGNAVQWNSVGLIVASWICAPLCTGALAGGFFIILRTFVLRHDNAFDRTFWVFPIVTFYTLFIDSFFVMYGSGIATGKGISRVNIPPQYGVGIAILIGVIFAIISFFVARPLKRYIAGLSEEKVNELFEGVITAKELQKGDSISTIAGEQADKTGEVEVSQKHYHIVDRFLQQDKLHASIQNDAVVAEIHNQAEKFNYRSEYAFGYLQVLTACFASFAHGANDVGTFTGPMAAINTIYNKGAGALDPSKPKAPIDDWILGIGGAGLILGLALYGQKIIAAMGVKLIRITPSRGFCIELGAATITVIGTYLAIPLSSSQGFVGALLGVGLAEGSLKTANWKLFGLNVASWAGTLIIMGLLSAALFSYVTFGPSQIYPLSKQNCMAYYTTTNNVANGDPSVICLNAQDGRINVLYGYPSTGVIQSA